MTLEEALDRYSEKFGGVPFAFLNWGDKEEVIRLVTEALETGKEFEYPNDERIYD